MSTSPTNAVRQGVPSRSALAVASLRAVHQLLDEPLVLRDQIALPLLGSPAEAALRGDPFVLNDPLSRGLCGALVARGRFAEDELSRCVAEGVRQYPVLGAGLDTFACRNPYRNEVLRVFEVDHPGTQRWKQQLLASRGGCLCRGQLPVLRLSRSGDDAQSDRARRQRRPRAAGCRGWRAMAVELRSGAAAKSAARTGFQFGGKSHSGRTQPAVLRAAQGWVVHGWRGPRHVREQVKPDR